LTLAPHKLSFLRKLRFNFVEAALSGSLRPSEKRDGCDGAGTHIGWLNQRFRPLTACTVSGSLKKAT